ncbi:helix-turn-helix transcriptional regulator [Citrobacter sp. FDAARGOS_156]|uniref:helix-turn-helix transcriptional regulator n=1 Tax=Citrobacter TaxID=544 RepID=UPI001908D6DC|nr:helix-turn-helix transcriptional regulator [Citrobacter sp. FDAARGOS_156]MBJ9642019.1 helix-turn-helix transcriptional regulator [Citrobacter sp. FDAARGOS_156]
MSMTQGEKLALIRDSERLTKRQMSELTGLNYSSYGGYERDRTKMTFEAAISIFGHPRFHKYQDWFMYDRTDPSRGQIAPALAHNGLDGIQSGHSGKQTG